MKIVQFRILFHAQINHFSHKLPYIVDYYDKTEA